MKYKEFVTWCNERATDGCWSCETAEICIQIMAVLRKSSFWKRRKYWNSIKDTVIETIVNPTNALIAKIGKNN